MRAIVRGAVVAGVLAVALGAATLARAGGGCHEGASVARGTTVELTRNCFVGTVTYAPAGEHVIFVNRDKVAHTITGVGWDAGELDGLDRTFLSFPEEGIYAYTCVFHPGMSGALVIGDPEGPGAADSPPVGVPDHSQTVAPEPQTGPTDPSSAPALGVIAGLIAGGLGFGLGRRARR